VMLTVLTWARSGKKYEIRVPCQRPDQQTGMLIMQVLSHLQTDDRIKTPS